MRRPMNAPYTVEAEGWSEEFFRAIGTPISWLIFEEPYLHYQKIGDTLLVIASGATEADGKRWIHVSLSRPSRLPSWEDVREVKDTFIGPDRKAIQVLPPKAEYVNVHRYTLHLFCCLDGDPLPDFRKAGII